MAVISESVDKNSTGSYKDGSQGSINHIILQLGL